MLAVYRRLALVALALVLACQSAHGVIFIQSGSVPTALPDWTSSFFAVWDLDESTGAARVNAGACGGTASDCDLDDVNTVDQDATAPAEGSASAQFAGNNDALRQKSGFTALDFSGDLCAGGYLRIDTQAANRRTFYKTSGNKGWSFIRGSGDKMSCQIKDGSDNVTQTSTNTFSEGAGVWEFAVCHFDDTLDEVSTYMDGAFSATSTQQTMSSTTSLFTLGNTSSTYRGDIDMAFVDDDICAAEDLCRICSCWIDGGLCTRNGTGFATCSSNSDCTSCAGCSASAVCSGGSCQGNRTTICSSCTVGDLSRDRS